jgi:hypothetical protein
MAEASLPIINLTNQQQLLRIVAPVFALVLLSFVVLAVLGTLRWRGIQRRSYPRGYFKLLNKPPEAQLPVLGEAAARNFINLFELPVLFYALVPLLALTGLWNDTSVALLWAFVALRYIHTVIHLTVNIIALRFAAYLACAVVLGVEWARFALAVLASA